MFVLSEVRHRTHNRVWRLLRTHSKVLQIDVGTHPLPAIVRISQVLFDSKFPCKLIQYGEHSVMKAVLNKGPPVDGGGLFLRGRSQETPSPLLSFLLFSLAGCAGPLLSTAIAVRTPLCRQCLFLRTRRPLQAPLMHLSRLLASDLPTHSRAEQSPSNLQSAIRFDPLQKPLFSIHLLLLLIIAVQPEQRDKPNKRVDDVFA